MSVLQFEILHPHHIKAGLDIQEDDHVLQVRYRGVSILRYPTSGAISKHSIRQDADNWLARHKNLKLYPVNPVGHAGDS